MRPSSAALRLQIESALNGRVQSPFRLRETQATSTAAVGIPVLDASTGGLPRGSLTEIYGPVSSGKTSFLLSTLAGRTANAEVCALVDAQDAFDPLGADAAGVRLERLLWVRCRGIDPALRSVDLLLHAGGFGLIALDLSDAPARLVRQIPLNVWFRLRRAVERTPTNLLVLSRESNAKTCASLVLRLEKEAASWNLPARQGTGQTAHTPACMLDGWITAAEIVRSRIQRPNEIAEEPPSHADSSPSKNLESSGEVCFVLRQEFSRDNRAPHDLRAPIRKILWFDPEKERRQNPG
jgi:recombination protein RecA